MTPQQPREDDAHSSSDEDDEAGTAFSDYVALDDAARRRPRDARPDAWTAPVLDDALQRRPIKPPPPPAADEIPRPRPTSVRFVPQRPPCKSLRELALEIEPSNAEVKKELARAKSLQKDADRKAAGMFTKMMAEGELL